MLLDFAAFESSIVRVQFLLTSNIKERERYAEEKVKIQAAARAVKDNTAELRVQLEEAQRTLTLKKEYDELAEKITSNRLLRPREDQHINLEKLNAEIADLERESQEYAQTWAERREQFGKIIEEGMQLRRLIRDEKEEVERREGMEGDDGDDGDTASHRGRSSGAATPRVDGGDSTPMHGVDRETISPNRHLQVDRAHTPRDQSLLRTLDTAIEERGNRLVQIEVEDTNMEEDGEVFSAGPDKIAHLPGEIVNDNEIEEGEEDEAEAGTAEEDSRLDHMDTS